MRQAIELGRILIGRTCVSAAFLDEDTAVTGSVDGRIYLWKKRYLQSAEKAHDKPVLDLDSPRGRGLFRGTLMITLAGARKEVLSLLSQGARSMEDRQSIADTAMQSWFDEWTDSVGRPPEVKSAVVSWASAENGGMSSCGGQEVKVWGWDLELSVGFSGFALNDSFERYSTAGRGRHKWRARSMTLQEFCSFLQGVGLLFDPRKPLKGFKGKGDEGEGISHPVVNSVEAARTFAKADMDEVGMEEFVQLVGQIVGLIMAKELGETPYCDRKEKLEMDMLDLQGHLVDLERHSVSGNCALPRSTACTLSRSCPF